MSKEEKEGIIIYNISELFLGKTEYRIENSEKNDAIVVEKEKIVAIGKTANILANYKLQDYEGIDCKGKHAVCPGFVDSHTHLVFDGDRAHELKMKIEGKTYKEIAEKGGGISYTVNMTRKAEKKQLEEKAMQRLNEMLLHGTTTIEAKSGYGLTEESEIKLLEVANEVNEKHPIDIISTFLGCHIKPKDFEGSEMEYVEKMIKILPEIKRRNLAEYTDIWVDQGAFTVETSKHYLQTAKDLGFQLRIHADEMDNVGGALLAAEMECHSADHLLMADEKSAKAMAKAKVVANLLPGTPFVLMIKEYANYKMLVDAGVEVALSTDFNPNCHMTNMQTIIGLGSFMQKMTPEQAMNAATYGGALSLKREKEVGTLDIEKKADIVILNCPTIDHIVYQFGINHVKHVIKNGKIVVKDGKNVI